MNTVEKKKKRETQRMYGRLLSISMRINALLLITILKRDVRQF